MKWKLIKADGVSVKSRHGHRAVAVNDGIIIYGGGKRKICKEFVICVIFLIKNVFLQVINSTFTKSFRTRTFFPC